MLCTWFSQGHFLASWLEPSVLGNAGYPGRVHIPKPLGTALHPAESVLPLSALKSTAAASTDLWFSPGGGPAQPHTCTGLPERLLRLPVYTFPSFLISRPVDPSISSWPDSWSLPPQPISTRVLCCDTSFLQWAWEIVSTWKHGHLWDLPSQPLQSPAACSSLSENSWVMYFVAVYGHRACLIQWFH